MPGFEENIKTWLTEKPLKEKEEKSDFGFFQKYILSLFNGIDIFAWTLTRVIEALDPNYFNDPNHSVYKNLIGSNPIGSIVILSIASIAALSNFIIDAYQDYKGNLFNKKIRSVEGIKTIHSQATGKLELDKESIQQLEAITEQRFGGYYKLIEQDGQLKLNVVPGKKRPGTKPNSRRDQKAAALNKWTGQHKTTAEDHIKNVTLNNFEKAMLWLAKSWPFKVIKPIWKFLAAYSFAYWITFMVPHVVQAFFHTTITLSPLAAFGIPLLFIAAIPCAALIAWKLYDWFKQPKAIAQHTTTAESGKDKVETPIATADHQAEADLADILKSYYQKHLKSIYVKQRAKAIQDNLHAQQGKLKQFLLTNAKLALQEVKEDCKNEVKEKVTAKNVNGFWQALSNPRAWKVAFAALVGSISGYIVSQFVMWPMLDFAIKVLHVSAGLGPLTLIPFSVALAIGIGLAIYSGVTASKRLKETDDALKRKEIITGIDADQLETLAHANEKLLQNCDALNRQIAEKVQKINTLIIINNPSQTALNTSEWTVKNTFVGQYHNERYFRTLQEQTSKTTLFKSLLHRFQIIVGGTGSGIFIARTLLTPALASLGAIAFFVPVSWPIFIGVAFGLGAIMAGIRLYEHYSDKAQKAAEQNVKELATRKQYLDSEKTVLQEMHHTLKERQAWLDSFATHLEATKSYTVQTLSGVKKPQAVTHETPSPATAAVYSLTAT